MKKEFLINLEEFEEAEQYWTGKLSGDIAETKLLRDKPETQQYEKAAVQIEFKGEVKERIDQISKNNDLSLYIILLTAFKILLSKYTGQKEIIVTSPVYTPENKEYNQFVAFRDRLEPGMSFKETLMSVKKTVVEGYQNEHYPLEKLIEYQEMDPSQVYRHIFQYDRIHDTEMVTGLIAQNPNDIIYTLTKNEDELNGEIAYNAKLFTEGTIRRMMETYHRILPQLLNRTGMPVSDLEWMAEEEKNKILQEFNRTDRDHPEPQLIHRMFEQQVEKHPGRIAVQSTVDVTNIYDESKSEAIDIQLDYEDLNQRIRQLAGELRANGVTAGSIVGVQVRHPLEMAVALLGVLKAGGAYLPLDPAYPPKAREYIMKDSNMQVLVTEQTQEIEGGEEHDIPEIPVVYVDDEGMSDTGEIENQKDVTPADPAYIIYTSGTTGKPKGTMVEHRGVVNFARWRIAAYGNTEEDVTLQLLSYNFDGFGTNFYTSQLSGGAQFIVPEARKLDYEYIRGIIREKGVTNTSLVPAMYEVIVDGSDPEDMKTLRYVVLAGEKCSPELIRRSKAKAPGIRLINEYGPTEATITVAANQQLDENNTAVVGKPIDNTRLYILDAQHRPVPFDVAGELCIAGHGLARGYLNKPELTQEKFVMEETLGTGGNNAERLYKTGDMARRQPDGNIEFLGRRDQQVKLRGFRIELAEIENQLLTHKCIKAAVVTAKENEEGNKYLSAYYVENILEKSGDLQSETLKEHLLKSLPEYMIPNYFVKLERIPRTPNGKIDRKALPEPDISVEEEYTPPANAVEEKLVEIWSDVLNIDKSAVSVRGNFFEMGGHSLRATIMVTRIQKELKVKISLAEVFEMPTIRELAGKLEGVETESYALIEAVEKKEYYPLSSAQKRLYFIQQMEPATIGYNVPHVYPLGKNLDIDKLEQVIRKLVARHESLRTSLEIVNGDPVQRVYDTVELTLQRYKQEAGPGARTAEEIVKDFVKPFDLSRAPLLRSGVITQPDGGNIWLVDMHHLVSDGTSMTIMTEDFLATAAGEELPELRIQYKDFSEWQNRLFQSGRIKEQEQYWMDKFADMDEIPPLQLPADKKRPEVFDFDGANYSFRLGRNARAFRAQAARYNGTLYMNFLAALNVLFYKYTGNNDIIIGCGVAGRPHADLQGIIGMFVNTLAMRNHPGREKTYEELLKEVIDNSIKAFENQDLQFEELVDKLKLQRDASRNPLFDVLMVVQNYRRPEERDQKETGNQAGEPPVQLEVLPAPAENQSTVKYNYDTAKFDMTYFVQEQDDDVAVSIQYYSTVYDKETVARQVGHLQQVITAVVENPRIKLDEIDIITQQEKQHQLDRFNDTRTPYPREKNIVELFEEQVDKTPDRRAVVFEGQALTYRELDSRANRVAAYLREEIGQQTEQPVGLLMDKSLDMIVVVQGILKAGGAYLPISPANPEERIKRVLEDSGVTVLLGHKRYIKTLNRMQWDIDKLDTILAVDSQDIKAEKESEENELMDRKLWEYVGETSVDEVTGGGWNSSYTGNPIPKEEMDEYGDNILKKVEPLLHKDMRVLEIGAASGITMYRIAPRVAQYTGTDLSGVIIEKNRQRVEEEGHKNIKLARMAAHEIDRLEEADYDLVIINSVIQCFHGHNYLQDVLKKVVNKMKNTGHIFIGDIMDQELKNALIADLERFKRDNRDKDYKTKTDWSKELFISRAYLEDTAQDIPAIGDIEFSGKIHTMENELTGYRYDALLRIDRAAALTKPAKPRHKRQHDARNLENHGAERKPVEIEPTNLAYIIYTSGSTGEPKGVMVEHRNVVRLVKETGYVQFREGDRILQTGALEFDASTFEVWGALLNGLELHLAARETLLTPANIKRIIDEDGISTIWMTAPLFNQMVDTDIEIFRGLRNLLVGGDVLSPPHINRLKRMYPHIEIINGYGPTENTTFSTTYTIPGEQDAAIPIGKPIANSTAYIVDKNHRQVPVGVEGELLVGGDGVARGYLNAPEQTAEKFISSPFTLHTSLYKTGDRVKWRRDGNIEFAGRIDRQVKIRGFRIELGEIENRLREHDAVREAVVIAADDENANKYLCAYIVAAAETTKETEEKVEEKVEDKAGEKAFDPSELREYLSMRLPDYMVPTYYVTLDNIPLNRNGKVDSKALPDPEDQLTGEGYEAPRNKVEEALVETWQQVLGMRRIGITDNFFEVGGDSIKAIQVSARLKNKGYELKISDLFLNPEIKRLSRTVTEMEQVDHQETVEGEVLLTPIQHWFFESEFEDKHHFNQAVMMYRKDGIDPEKLRKVATKLVEHHDALRMIFETKNNAVKQVNRGISDPLFDQEIFDLTGREDIEAKREIEAEAQKQQQGFRLETGPLVKLGLFKTDVGDHLLIVIHHLVVDGISWRILLEDLDIGFRQLEEGKEINFQAKTGSYRDWSEKLQQYAGTKKLLKEQDYWKALEETKIEALVKDRNIDPEKRKQKYTATVEMNLDEEKTRQLLKKVNHAYNTEIDDILLTALVMAIKEWQGIDNVLINLERHGREDIIEGQNTSRTVGWFTSQFPVILNHGESGQLARRIKVIKETLRQIPAKGIGYGILKYLTPPENKKGLNFRQKPEISFNNLGRFGRERDHRRGYFDMSPLNTGRPVSTEMKQENAVEIIGMMMGGQMKIAFRHNPDEFGRRRIKELVESYKRHLLRIIDHCSGRTVKEQTPSDVGCNTLTIDELGTIEKHIEQNIGKEMEIDQIYPMTPMQGGMLYHSVRSIQAGTRGTYVDQMEFTAKGIIDPEVLEGSYVNLLERHDIFRTIFVYEKLQTPLQVVLKERKANIGFHDIAEREQTERERYIEEFKQKQRQDGFDLAKDVLITINIFKTGDEDWLLLISFHHILMDGWCLGLVFRDLILGYRCIKRGEPVELGYVSPYRNYISWLEEQDKEEGLRYWAEYLGGYRQKAGLQPAKQVVWEGAHRYELERYRVEYDEEITARLNQIAAQNQVTVNQVFRVLWAIQLFEYNHVDDVVFGAVVSGRAPEVEGIEGMVGLFINTMPVRITKEKGETYSQLLRRVRERDIISRKYEYVPLPEIQANTHLKGNLFDHIMALQNYPVEQIKETGRKEEMEFRIETADSEDQPNYDLNFIVGPGRTLQVEFNYNSVVYEKDFIKQVESHFREIVRAVVENPDIPLDDIEMVSEEEKIKILSESNIEQGGEDYDF